VPSGGARHSLELYLIATNVAGLADLRRRTLCVPMQEDQPPPAGLYLTSCAYRTGWKYRGMALSLIYRDTGCLMQTLSLVGTDLGLATCLTGRTEAPMTPSFLRPYQGRLIHVGDMALGMPPAASTPPPLIPLGTNTSPERA
jgi:hypothetical protein